MSNAVTTTSANAVATTGGMNAFEAYGQSVSSNRIVGDLLKFNKGEWLAGQNADDVALGTRVVAIMSTMSVGWVKWSDGKPVDYRMGALSDGFAPPRRDDLGDDDKELWEIDEQTGKPRDPWQLSNYVVFAEADAKGAPTGKLYTFTTSSKGGMGAVGKFCAAYGKNLRMKPNDYPILTLGKDKYKHPNKEYGWIHFPKLDVAGWVDRAAADALLSADNEAAAQAPASDDDIPF